MGMQVKIEVDVGSFSKWIRLRAEQKTPKARRRMIERVTHLILYRTIEFNPVDTARSRASWVASLAKLGHAPPANWRGKFPQAKAIQEGIQLSGLVVQERKEETQVRISSGVKYIGFLEFGTRYMNPFAMVRRALRSVAKSADLGRLFTSNWD